MRVPGSQFPGRRARSWSGGIRRKPQCRGSARTGWGGAGRGGAREAAVEGPLGRAAAAAARAAGKECGGADARRSSSCCSCCRRQSNLDPRAPDTRCLAMVSEAADVGRGPPEMTSEPWETETGPLGISQAALGTSRSYFITRLNWWDPQTDNLRLQIGEHWTPSPPARARSIRIYHGTIDLRITSLPLPPPRPREEKIENAGDEGVSFWKNAGGCSWRGGRG